MSPRAPPRAARLDPVEDLVRRRERVLGEARAAMGITGDDAPPLRQSIGAAGWYPLIALSMLVLVVDFQSLAFAVVGPEVASTLGISKAELTATLLVKGLAATAISFPAAAYVQRQGRRAAVCIATAFLWTVFTGLTTFAVGVLGLLVVLVADGLSAGAVRTIHPPLLIDYYPPAARVRALSFYRAAAAAGAVVAPLMVFIAVSVLDLTWRGVFLLMAGICLAASVIAIRLRDPGYGRLDIDQVRGAVRAREGDDEPVSHATADPATQLGVVETCRRLLLIPTIKRIVVADAVLGMLLAPLTTYLYFFLQERWGVGPGGRALFAATAPLFGVAALFAFGRRGEDMFRRDPARVVRLAGTLMVVLLVVIALALLSPWFAVMLLLFGLAQAPLAAITPALNISVMSIVPPRMRAQAASLEAIAIYGIGGFTGLALLGGVDRRFGTTGAMLSLLGPGIVGALLVRSAARTVDDDLDRMLDDVIEDEELNELRAAGRHVPMLACRNIDFSYGLLQVLFKVDFTVDEGEMVALLGTNGAGKSTLLRVISGLGFPTRGGVRLDGTDVTYLDPERRLALGISQIPGGRAVFPPLSVVDNLRVSGFTFGRDRAAVDRGIEQTFNAFPRLAERRNQLASTLSGGEQQMLGLGKAFVLQPRLLLIDELSLGLAPKVVGELLTMVRDINAAGTAVVLVEQSVNLALSLVQRAYFMEKGEMRFDGRASDLLDRPDLLRSVFLEGAGSNGKMGGR